METVAAAPAVAASASTERASSGDAPSAIALLKARGRRRQRVDHGLVALAGGAELLDARQGRIERGGQRGQVDVGGASQRLAGPAESRAVERA